MKLVAEDRETITIQFSRAEATNIRAAVNYVSSLFEYLDREALDGWRMTMDDADRISDDFTDITLGQRASLVSVSGV